jgi:hypothetical protein
VEADLKKIGSSYVVREANRLGPNDSRPTYEVVSFTVHDFTHLKHHGELEISFFNNRLLETTFFPQDIDGYLMALKETGLTVSKEPQLRGDTWVMTFEAHDGRRYVRWADRRLDDEHTRWIGRYS